MKVAIIGVGNVGSALGERLAETGFDVVFGVRPGRSVEELLARCGGRARAVSPAEAMAEADLAFLAVASDAAIAALEGAPVAGKVIVDCNNPISWEEGPAWDPPAEGSITAQLAAAYPEGRFIKGFSTFGTEFHRDPDLDGAPIDVQLAGDDSEAKERIAELARRAGFRPIDAGPLRNAGLLENLAILWIHLAMFGGHGRRIGFRLHHRD